MPKEIKFSDSGSDAQRARILLMIEEFEKPYIAKRDRAENAAIESRARRIDGLLGGR